MPDDPRLVRLARLAKLRALRAQAVPRPSEFADVQSGASTTAPQPANAPALAGAMFGDADLQDAAKGFGLPQGEPGAVDTRAVQGAIRQANVASGVEEPRLSERLVKAAGLDPGTAAAVTGLENAVRGLPSGAVQGILGGTADAVKAGGILLDPFRALGELAAGQRPSALQASDLLREQVEAPAVNAIRNVTRPEGTGGMIGEQVGSLAAQGGVLKGLAALRALRAERALASQAESDLLARMTDAPSAGAEFRANRFQTVRQRAEDAAPANAAAGQGIERLAQTERRLALEGEAPSKTSQLLRQADEALLAPRVRSEARRARLAAEEAAAEADPLRQAMRATFARPRVPDPVTPEPVSPVASTNDRLTNLRAILGERSAPAARQADPTLDRLVEAQAEANAPTPRGPNLRDHSGRIGPVYHGSPHRFDQFSMEKIGTGEGGQAFGHGLYFAEKPETARSYQRLGGEEYFVDGEPTGIESRAAGRTSTALGIVEARGWQGAHDYIAGALTSPAMTAENRPWYEGLLAEIDGLKGKTVDLRPKGAFYHAALDADPDELLLWDKPFNEQPAKVQDALTRLYRERGFPLDEQGNPLFFRRNPDGQILYASAVGMTPESQAPAMFREAGIKGIKYLDGWSRSAGAGTHNYVVFDDKLINILNREGKLTAGGLQMLAPIVTTGTGAATGAATDKEHPIRGAVLGGLAGAALGAAAGGALGRRGGVAVEPEPVTSATTQQAIDDLLASVKPATAKMKQAAQAEAGLGGIPQGPARAEADQFVNVAKFSFTDPSGETRLRQTVSRIAEGKGAIPKRVVTWDEAKAQAAKLGLNPEALSRKKVDRLRGPDLLAIRNIVSDNIEAMETAARKLSTDGTLTDLERRRLMAQTNALDTQNMALLDKFTEARTRAGRDLNNLKIVAMRTNDPVLWLAKARQWAGKDLEPTTRDLIVQLASEGKVQDYLALMGTLRKAGPLEKLATFFKANLLTNPLTHIVNTTSNVQLAGLEAAKDVPGAAFDRLLGMATGRRTLTAPTVRQLRAGLAGARQGLREAGQVMRGIPLDEALEKFDFPRETQYTSPLVGKLLTAYTRTPFRALGAADRVFKTAALRYSLANQAEARGLDVAATLADPPEDMMVQAILDAAQATVQDKTKVGDLLRSVSQAGGGAGQFVVPFSRTPGAVATRVAEYTPIGGIMGGVKAVKVVRSALKGAELSVAEQREAAKLLGRATTGSGILALGYWLASKGLASGTTGHGDTGQRDTNYLTGRPDNALKVGRTWLALGRMSPAGMLLAVGANLYDVDQGGTTPLDAAGGMAGTIAQAVTDQPFLTGISNALELAQNPKKASTYGKLASDIATGFLPASAALGAVARGTDASVRDPKTLGEKIQSRIPGAAEQLPVMLDQFGRAVPREGGLTDAMLNPLKRTTDQTNDPALREIARLGITISRRRPSGTRDRDATRTLTAYEGPAIQKRLERIVADPRYAALDDIQRKYVLERAILRTRAEATRRLKAAR